MISRRAFLGASTAITATGALTAAGLITGTLDDVLRGFGIRPHLEPDPGDERRLAAAAAAQAEAVAALEGLPDPDPKVVAAARAQLSALGGTAIAPTSSGDPLAVAALLATSARDREQDAIATVSPDLARLFAAQSAGLAQLARRTKERA